MWDVCFSSTVFKQWDLLWKTWGRGLRSQLPGDVFLWLPPHGGAFVLPSAPPAHHCGPEHKANRSARLLSSSRGALGCWVSSDSKALHLCCLFNHQYKKKKLTISCSFIYFQEISGLQNCRELVKLYLYDNQIREIKNLTLQTNLEVLWLNNNCINKIQVWTLILLIFCICILSVSIDKQIIMGSWPMFFIYCWCFLLVCTFKWISFVHAYLLFFTLFMCISEELENSGKPQRTKPRWQQYWNDW